MWEVGARTTDRFRGVRGRRLLLASRSPRRRELLLSHGIEHDAEHPGIEDADLVPGAVSPEAWVAALAYLKAWVGARLVRERGGGARIVLGADTACVLDGRLVGTPRNAGEAGAMIRQMAGREHDVVTGVALVDTETGARALFADRARVEIGTIAEGEIEAYLAGGGWAGKAGAYNLAERLDAGWPIRHRGDPTTIMGLPMRALLRVLGGGEGER